VSQPYDEQLAGPPTDTSVEADQEEREPLTATDEAEPAEEAEP